MNWSPVTVDNVSIGNKALINNTLVFFGNKNSSRHSIARAFPELEFSYIRQVHGSTLIEMTKQGIEKEIWPEADAQWTFAKNVGLCIVTADCLPILFSNHSWVCGLHAGWRGLAQGILILSLKKLSKPQDAKMIGFVGPHIKKENFEVNVATANSIYNATIQHAIKDSHTIQLATELKQLKSPAMKTNISLDEIAKSQWQQSIGNSDSLWISYEDTFDNINYNSFRRNPTVKGRQISFIAKI